MKKLIPILLMSLFALACSSTARPEYLTTEYDGEEKTWVEGRPYYIKGADTTICGDTFELEKPKGDKVSKVKYQRCYKRRWEHKHTAGGEIIDVWYWDDESCTWYSMPKTGDYYVFRWIYFTKSILDTPIKK